MSAILRAFQNSNQGDRGTGVNKREEKGRFGSRIKMEGAINRRECMIGMKKNS
jgi:hypothetical protein